jgi:hypothetical protein
MIHIIINYFYFLHEDLDYSQMYNFWFLTMMTNFEFFLTIKDVQNQNQQHPL